MSTDDADGLGDIGARIAGDGRVEGIGEIAALLTIVSGEAAQVDLTGVPAESWSTELTRETVLALNVPSEWWARCVCEESYEEAASSRRRVLRFRICQMLDRVPAIQSASDEACSLCNTEVLAIADRECDECEEEWGVCHRCWPPSLREAGDDSICPNCMVGRLKRDYLQAIDLDWLIGVTDGKWSKTGWRRKMSTLNNGAGSVRKEGVLSPITRR